MTLRQAIQHVQQIGEKSNFSIAIVGGAMVRLIGPTTTIHSIDIEKRIIVLKNANNPPLSREEDRGTLIDIDAIGFSTEKNPFTKKTGDDFSSLLRQLKTPQGFPPISIEPVFYHPPFAIPHSLTQFVSSVERNDNGNYFFRLSSITQEVTDESLAIWTVKFVDNPKEEVLTLNPLAIQRRYAIRGFSKKPKDIEKVWGETSSFAKYVKEFNAKTKGQFEKYFKEWDLFEEKLQRSKDVQIMAKRSLWNLYWRSIGTYLAHGTGFLGKLLLPLGNTLFAGK